MQKTEVDTGNTPLALGITSLAMSILLTIAFPITIVLAIMAIRGGRRLPGNGKAKAGVVMGWAAIVITSLIIVAAGLMVVFYAGDAYNSAADRVNAEQARTEVQ